VVIVRQREQVIAGPWVPGFHVPLAIVCGWDLWPQGNGDYNRCPGDRSRTRLVAWPFSRECPPGGDRRDRGSSSHDLGPGAGGLPRDLRGYPRAPRNRSAFTTTETELRLIAAAANIGESRTPKAGYRAPAARGTPSAL
jgi:hypothetical protein